jgi:hypothetical protein
MAAPPIAMKWRFIFDNWFEDPKIVYFRIKNPEEQH